MQAKLLPAPGRPRSHRNHAKRTQLAGRSRRPGTQPDFVQPHDVLIGVHIGRIRNLVEHINERLELGGQFVEHVAEHGRAAPISHGVRKITVSRSAHGDVVVDIDLVARETAREKPDMNRATSPSRR